MLGYLEALEVLLKHTTLLPTVACPLEHAAGRVLRARIHADRDFPAFDRVMMDGYALRFADWEAGYRRFSVTGSSPAGAPQASLSHEIGTCVEIMTGAPCPVGADTILPVESVATREIDSVTFLETSAPVIARFIHCAGSDAIAGRLLLDMGSRLGSREIGVAASCGAASVEVSVPPNIAVIATGDELVAVGEKPAPHQIRQSNGHSLAAALTRMGHAPAHVGGLGDELAISRPAMKRHLEEHEWLILTGAVSMGARDFIPALLDELGCRKIFHGIAHRPGKPAGFWVGPNGQMIFALPGNPVSALTGLHVLVWPALAAAMGCMASTPRWVVMEDGTQQLENFTRHLPVMVRSDGRAEPASIGNSGDFIGLLRSDGFVTLPPRGALATAYPFTPWL